MSSKGIVDIEHDGNEEFHDVELEISGKIQRIISIAEEADEETVIGEK